MVYMLLGTGFEETEAIAPLDLLRRAGVEILTVGINGKTVSGSHKIKVEADITIGEMDLTDVEMVIIPGSGVPPGVLHRYPPATTSASWRSAQAVSVSMAPGSRVSSLS